MIGGWADPEDVPPSFERIIVPCRLGYAPPLQQVVPSDGADPTSTDQQPTGTRRGNRDRLIIALHKARGWLDELLRGKAGSLDAIADQEGRSTANIALMIRLAFLAPDIIEAILAGKSPAALGATDIARNLPLDWADQRTWIAAQA